MSIHSHSLSELTWDINENIPKDEVSRGVLKCLSMSSQRRLRGTYPDEIRMDLPFLPYCIAPSIHGSFMRSFQAPTSQRPK